VGRNDIDDEVAAEVLDQSGVIAPLVPLATVAAAAAAGAVPLLQNGSKRYPSPRHRLEHSTTPPHPTRQSRKSHRHLED